MCGLCGCEFPGRSSRRLAPCCSMSVWLSMTASILIWPYDFLIADIRRPRERVGKFLGRMEIGGIRMLV